MRGEGEISNAISRLFKISKHKFMGEPESFKLNCDDFNFRAGDAQLSLF